MDVVIGQVWVGNLLYQLEHNTGEIFALDESGTIYDDGQFSGPSLSMWDITHDGTNFWAVDQSNGNARIVPFNVQGELPGAVAAPASDPRGIAWD